jgi:hypothetical protein
MSEVTLFNILNNIFFEKEKFIYDKKAAPAYALSMWLSHDQELLNIVNDINRFQFLLPDEVIYRYYRYMIPKKKRNIKWIKKIEDRFKEHIKKLQEKNPEMSTREARMYITYLLHGKKNIKNVKEVIL